MDILASIGVSPLLALIIVTRLASSVGNADRFIKVKLRQWFELLAQGASSFHVVSISLVSTRYQYHYERYVI